MSAATARTLSRRQLFNSAATLGAGAALSAALPMRWAAAADLVVGFIYVGPHDDFGYNQAHAQGAAAVNKMAGVKVLEEENVPEDVAVTKTMESMIGQDGATLLFPTSFGYFDPYILRAAPKFPKIRFEHCGGLWKPKDPKNAGSYFGYIFEAQHVNGIVAGYASKSGKLGLCRGQAHSASPAEHQRLHPGGQAGQSQGHHAASSLPATGRCRSRRRRRPTA